MQLFRGRHQLKLLSQQRSMRRTADITIFICEYEILGMFFFFQFNLQTAITLMTLRIWKNNGYGEKILQESDRDNANDDIKLHFVR